MKANADKCHLLVTVNYEVPANINEFKIENSKKEKLLGILTLDFLSSIITFLCKKLHALTRITHHMDFEKRSSLMKAFAVSQFN